MMWSKLTSSGFTCKSGVHLWMPFWSMGKRRSLVSERMSPSSFLQPSMLPLLHLWHLGPGAVAKTIEHWQHWLGLQCLSPKAVPGRNVLLLWQRIFLSGSFLDDGHRGKVETLYYAENTSSWLIHQENRVPGAKAWLLDGKYSSIWYCHSLDWLTVIQYLPHHVVCVGIDLGLILTNWTPIGPSFWFLFLWPSTLIYVSVPLSIAPLLDSVFFS